MAQPKEATKSIRHLSTALRNKIITKMKKEVTKSAYRNRGIWMSRMLIAIHSLSRHVN
jgi:hypothetical protein